MNTILEVHKKYNALVLTAFNNDSGFVAALDKACGRFINSNAVTRQANSSSKSPELLAKYCDLLLKKSSKNPEEAELEDTLNQVVSVNFEIGTCVVLLFFFIDAAYLHTETVGELKFPNLYYLAETSDLYSRREMSGFIASITVVFPPPPQTVSSNSCG